MLETISTFTVGRAADLFPTELASPLRDSFAYLTYAGGLSEPGGGSGVFDLYNAERNETGWLTSDRISRSSKTIAWTIPGGVSPDHAYAFSNDEGIDYLVTPIGSELVGHGSLADEPYAQGRYITKGGEHVIFSTGHDEISQSLWCYGVESKCKVRPLAEKAPPEGTGAIYDRSAGGVAHVVSLMPGDLPAKAGEEACFSGASADGTSVAFKLTADVNDCRSFTSGAAVLFVRVHNGDPAADETLEVAGGNPAYAGLSSDGRYLFYVTGGSNGTIHRLDTESKVDLEVNSGAEGSVVNVSADGSHVYFISELEINGKGTGGQPNLYAWSAGSAPQFLATVLPGDLTQTSGELVNTPALTNWTTDVTNPGLGGRQGPGAESSRTTANGEVLIFESRAKLTTYNNAGNTEVYRYREGDVGVACVSCGPVGTVAEHESRLQELNLVGPQIVIHNLSDDGNRVLFETSETLDARDVNGGNDIYEWQYQGGTPSVSLISSGKTPAYPLPKGWESPFAPLPNLLLGITPDGSNVFFTTKEGLTPEAGVNGTQAIYDARIGGGFSGPSSPALCLEEECKPGPTGAGGATSAVGSESAFSSGNVQRHRHRCHRKSRRGGGSKGRRCPRKQQRKGGARSSAAAATDQGAAPGDAEVPRGSSRITEAAASSTPTLLAGGTAKEFGIQKWEGKLSTTAAGAHPDFTTKFEINHFESGGLEEANAALEEVSIHLPPGLLGNPKAIPTCSMGDFLSFGACSADSQVGITQVKVGTPIDKLAVEPIYNLAPPHPDREVVRLGFIGYVYPVFIDVKVRTAGDYGATATVHDPPGLGVIIRATTKLWGNPSGEEHNKERFTSFEAALCPAGTACKAENGERPSTIPVAQRKAFMVNPSACQEGSLDLEVTSYQLPGQTFTASAPLAPITDCTGLPFAPSFEADPTSHTAGAPTGLKTKLILPQHLGENERATATMREARVTLPEGMQVAAGAANWIDTCSDAQVGYHEEVDTACPDGSKLGTATFISPALSVPIEGTIYQRAPEPGRQLGLWLTADALGLHIKLPGELEPDKTTGRLTAVFRDLPQVPVEEIDLDVWGGPRAPLQNPDHCGSFTTDFSFSPHSNDPAASGQSQMQITEGCNQPFDPTLHAGVTDPVAGKYSPFVFDLTRPDANQALRGFELHLPDGELAKIKGVPLCPEEAASSASCPQGSRIGSIQATTGPGPEPFTLPEPGKPQPQIYLSGPYKDSPFSIVSEVPAQAGPFDLGTLAVRSGLDVEPETGRAVVKADPLPQFFEGVGIAYRNIHAVVDRPEFNLNPTDCSEMAVTAEATSTKGTVAHPSARFQVDGCKALKFKPKLSLKLRGGTRRASYPALTAVLKARKGDANIASTSVALPHSEFLAQEHIGTICTRVQFAADNCPKGSVYGKAKAITPLLDKPLAGPVYLRSSNHPLPDLVAKLGGQLEIDLVGRIDSVNGGIRTSFESVPDAPVTKFVLQMKGGKKSLLTNSTDICRGSHKATVQMKAQNGRAATLRPKLVSSGCGKKKLGKHKHHH